MKVLIADDDLKSQQKLFRILSPYGACEIVDNGYDAIESFHISWREGEPYDLVLLELQLPLINGYSLMREIKDFEDRERRFVYHQTKVIVISDRLDAESIRDAFREQCDVYLMKPIIGIEILTAVFRLGLIIN